MGAMTTLRLGDAATKIGSGATPRGGDKVYQDSGVALIRSQNVYNDGFHQDGLAFISERHAEELSNVEVEAGDVLLNITGDSVARVCQVRDDILPARVNQHVAIIRPSPELLNARFLRYVLSSPRMQSHLHALASAGATRSALTKAMIQQLEIPRFSLGDQQAIADVLGALDDKIELNRRMNETLEAIARANFKSWFVDFDPVHAKAAGRQPFGMNAETAALFPNSFEDSAIGKIPKNWHVIKIGELFELAVGGDWGQEEPSDSYSVPVAVIRGTDFSNLRSCQDDEVPRRFVQASKYEKRRLQQFDVLVEISGGSPEQPTGRSLLVTEGVLKRLGGNVIPASFCRLIRSKSEHHAYFLALYLAHLYDDGGTWAYQNQSTGISNFQFTYFSNTESLPFPISDEIVEAFGDEVRPFFKKIDQNQTETVCLKAIRDALLPKLVSGEIRIKDAERTVKSKL